MAGSITFPGIGSGIDGASIAKAISDQYRLPNAVHQNSIDQLAGEISSLEQLRTLLLDVSDRLDALRTSNGGAAVKQASSSNNDVLRAAAGSGAKDGTYTVNVTSLATVAVGSFDRSFSAADEAIISDAVQSGAVEFSVGSGDDAEVFAVEVGPETTAQDFVTQFNQAANGAAVAHLINLSTVENPNYRISFTTSEAGTERGSITVSAENPALLEEDVLGGTTIEQATDARFSISGISGTFTRSSNVVSDAIAGVTLNLASPGSASVSVTPSADASADQVEAFVNAFNAVVRFVNTEDRVDVVEEDGERTNVYGSLARTSVDENAVLGLRDAIAGAKSGDGTLSLAALGVSTNRDGSLSFDREKFEAAFNGDAAGAEQVVTALADRVSGIQGVVHQFTGYGQQIDGAIKGDEAETSRLQDTISRVERAASAREQAIIGQFSRLEGLLAKLQADSSFISSLLQF